MIQSIFVVLGFVMFTDAMFEKFGVWSWIQFRGSKSGKEWIFKLTTCDFCMHFHLAWIITILYGVVNGLEWHLIAVPFIVSGFINMSRKYGL